MIDLMKNNNILGNNVTAYFDDWGAVGLAESDSGVFDYLYTGRHGIWFVGDDLARVYPLEYDNSRRALLYADL